MKTQTLIRFFAFLCLLALLVYTETSLAATVTLRVASVEGAPNSVVEVPIQTTGATNIGAVQFDVTYDPAVVKAQSVTRGPAAGNNALLESNPAQPGRLRVGYASAEGMKSDGIFATIRFTVTGSTGQSSNLTLENSRAWEISHVEALVKTEAGKVTVAADYSLWLLIAALCMVSLLLMVIIVVWLLLRRRRPASTQSAPPQSYAPPPPSSLPEREPSSGWVCRKCKTNNRPTARFCSQCGAPK